MTAWLAVAAVLAMSLAPTVSHALRGQTGSSWVELCTALGSKWVNLASDDRADEPPPTSLPTHVFEHCPYCALHVPDLGSAPATAALTLLDLDFETPRLFLAAPRTLHAWLAAQPRGPPALS